MYKIVFVVAVFAFALQGALCSPVNEVESAPLEVKADAPKSVGAVENKPADDPPTTVPTAAPETVTTTQAPKSGASSTEMCLLLVQVSSLALVAKHMLL
ncbi:uncharacterized protein LOC111028874 [Myzus persicae]|uniref:uncharacterized protein LOC111028874 n=1 Tax=Myzus persicae TaxID=13164 RepID=UPI000B937DD6|nr:uncharacterized protein LOC111028874 [Myzus persicae]